MYCSKCGYQIPDESVYCPKCGQPVQEDMNTQSNQNYQSYQSYQSYQRPMAASDDAYSIGFGILSCFFPIVGFILFFVWNKEYPLKAQSAIIGAAIGFFLGFFSFII